MNALGRNPDEWIEPEKYIPDRFNPSSPYFLTPSGKKRHPMSFSPFLGGKRICLGKSFAEIISRIIVPAIIYQFNFDFVSQD
jgi:cytochrome P450